MQITTWHAYDDASDSYFDSYERLSFSDMHRAFLKFLPQKGAACLDVGAGSGRDAAALARRGFSVTAAEPSRGLRALAQARHQSLGIRWIDDHLPQLKGVVASQERFAFILVSAVWMHVAPDDRGLAVRTLADLLEIDGHIAITLRQGDVSDGRLMYPVNTEELLSQAEENGLRAVYVSRRNKDSLARQDISWRKVVLAKK